MQKNERQSSIMWQILQLLLTVCQLLLFPPQKMMNLISDRLSTASIKYLNWPSPVFGRFQNGCNKVVIEPCGMQFGLCRKMWDKEYYMANSATFVSKTVIFSPKKIVEFDFKPAQYCFNKIFELTKSCIWAISKWM